VGPNVPGGLGIKSVSLAWLSDQWKLPDDFAPTAGLFLHMMHLRGPDAELTIGESRKGVNLLRVISSDRESRKYLGQPFAIPVRTGVRFPTVPADHRLATAGDESHRDQGLACLAQLGLPLSHPLQVDGLPYALKDVLQDSLANFDMHQKELEWTGMAYALYLPPLRQWRNRFGQSFSFDDLTKELLGRSLLHSPCGGSHRLIMLTTLHRLDKQHPILSAKVRIELDQFLKKAVEQAISTQRPDGGWPSTWTFGLIPDKNPRNWSLKDSSDTDVMIAGHVVEWFFNLDRELQPSKKTFETALGLIRSRVSSLEEREFLSNFCPYSHAIRVVNLAASEGRAPSNPPVQREP